jgi:hypothetical protein
MMLTVAVLAAATLGVAVFATFVLKMFTLVVRGCRVFFASNPVDIKEKFGTWAGKETFFLRNILQLCCFFRFGSRSRTKM